MVFVAARRMPLLHEGDFFGVDDIGACESHSGRDFTPQRPSRHLSFGLRDLLKPANLSHFLKPLADFRNSKKLEKCFFLKLSPDLEKQELIETIKVSVDNGFDGFVLTNTTLSRQPGMPFSHEGGVSGAPLKQLSLKALDVVTTTCRAFSDKKLIVSVGGVMTEADVFERINNGADLVQIYTALIYEGPGFFNKVAELAKRR